MKRFALLTIILLVSLGYYGYKHPRLLLELETTFFQTKDRRLLQTETMISLSYQLSRERWTEFTLGPAVDRVKGLTNCVIGIDPVNQGDVQKFHYAIDYQILDKSGEQVLHQGTYHFQSKVSLFTDSQGGEASPASFLDTPEEMSADGRIMQLNLKGLPLELEEKQIRFKIASTDPGVLGVLLRVYTRRQTMAKDGSNLWTRLHKYEQERLAKGNLYPRDLLSQWEIKNLMGSQWDPAGPAGIPNRDFTVRRLYVRKDFQDKVQEDRIEPLGLYADSHRVFTLAIPEEGKHLRFLFAKGTMVPEKSQQEPIVLNWYGKLVQENETLSLPWQGETREFSHFFRGGMIEILSGSPLEISVFDQDQGGEEIFPEQLFAKMYSVEPGKDLSYAVRHLDQRSTPLRVSMRSVDAGLSDERRPVILRYTLLAADGQAVREEKIQFVPKLSGYDRMVVTNGEEQVSDPEHLYLLVPEEATEIRFQSSDSLLLALANHPPAYVKKTRIPEDYFPSSFARKGQTESSWFTYPPLDYRELEKDSRARSLILQYRPPIRDPELLEGKFLWEAFRPEGKWGGNYLLVPRQENTPLRTEALRSTFHTIPVGKEVPIVLASLPGLSSIRPELIFLRDREEPGHLQLSVDGQSYFSQEIIGKQGILQLPPLTIGKHSLQITTDFAGKILLSNLLAGEPVYSLRFAYRLDGQGITFHYPKKEQEEMLGFFFYGACASNERTNLEVELHASAESMGPFAGLTQTRRVFDLRPGKKSPALPILYSEKHCVDQGQRFLFPLADDLTSKSYPVTVRVPQGKEGFLLMYRVTPGQYQGQSFIKEEY